jgi:hypothetical protein
MLGYYFDVNGLSVFVVVLVGFIFFLFFLPELYMHRLVSIVNGLVMFLDSM